MLKWGDVSPYGTFGNMWTQFCESQPGGECILQKSSGRKPGTLLNLLQYTGRTPTLSPIKNYLALNVSSVEANHLGVREITAFFSPLPLSFLGVVLSLLGEFLCCSLYSKEMISLLPPTKCDL